VILDQVVLCVHAALLSFAAQSIVHSLEVHEASGHQAEFMKDLAGQAYANWKKLGYVNHPGWSILNQGAYAAIVPRNAEQFAELQTTCVSGHQKSDAVRPYTCLCPAYCCQGSCILFPCNMRMAQGDNLRCMLVFDAQIPMRKSLLHFKGADSLLVKPCA
jgi:hypothetical protein